jgi:hypothetical protein
MYWVNQSPQEAKKGFHLKTHSALKASDLNDHEDLHFDELSQVGTFNK